jgi:hypothetical protein
MPSAAMTAARSRTIHHESGDVGAPESGVGRTILDTDTTRLSLALVSSAYPRTARRAETITQGQFLDGGASCLVSAVTQFPCRTTSPGPVKLTL